MGTFGVKMASDEYFCLSTVVGQHDLSFAAFNSLAKEGRKLVEAVPYPFGCNFNT